MEDNTPPLVTVDKLVAAYIKIRDAKEQIEDRHKKELEDISSQLELISNDILRVCNEQNMDSIKTQEGTITRRTVSRYWTSDWEKMYECIKNNDAPYLLEQRIHQTNMKQFLDENPTAFPPGLQSNSKYIISVRRSKGK